MEVNRVLSFGAGQDSTAIVVAQVLEMIEPFDSVVFAHVGEDSEHPDTLAYLDQVLIPYMARNGIRFEVVRKLHKGEPDSVRQKITRSQKLIPIPVWLAGAGPGRRTCTHDFKIEPIRRWIKANYPGALVELGIGFGADEMRRVKPDESNWHYEERGKRLGFIRRKVYPLIELGFRRVDAQNLIIRAGLPLPPPSRCTFCPFLGEHDWIAQRRERPDLFERSLEVEREVNQNRSDFAKDGVYLHRRRLPLEHAVGEQPSLLGLMLEDMDCGEGYCGV